MLPPPSTFPARPRLQPGDIVEGHYRIASLVGVGGMGAVYECTYLPSGERLALKEILFNATEMDANYFRKLQAAFLKEARVLINMDRTNFPAAGALVPRASDIFRANGTWYLVMEYLEGETLAERLEKEDATKGLPAELVIGWGIQLAHTLEFLHHLNPPLIHADIKPGNIKIGASGRLALLDFGIARGGHGYPTARYSRGTVQFVTPHYAAPEQVRGQGYSPATDIFSLGATLYHALTGARPPKVEARMYALALDRARDPLRPARDVNPRVPLFLSQLLTQCMALEVLQRPSNADQVRVMLEQRIVHPVIDMAEVSRGWEVPASRFGTISGNPASELRRAPSNPLGERQSPATRRRKPADYGGFGNLGTLAALMLIGAAMVALLLWTLMAARVAPHSEREAPNTLHDLALTATLVAPLFSGEAL